MARRRTNFSRALKVLSSTPGMKVVFRVERVPIRVVRVPIRVVRVAIRDFIAEIEIRKVKIKIKA